MLTKHKLQLFELWNYLFFLIFPPNIIIVRKQKCFIKIQKGLVIILRKLKARFVLFKCSKVYHWTSLVAYTVRNPPAMQETWIRSGSGRAPGEGMAAQSSILAWGNSMDRGAWRTKVRGVAKNRTQPSG